jgi:hypothetical protein
MEPTYIQGWPFYFFQADQSLVDRLLINLKQFPFKPTNSVSDQKIATHYGYCVNGKESTCYYDKELYDWLYSCLSLVYKNHFPQYDFVINDLWPVKSLFGQTSNFHYHSLSIFSGLLYLQDCKTATQYKFDDVFGNKWADFLTTEIKQITYKSNSEKGKLIIWPSHIRHSIAMNKEKEPRYTISFNSFFTGVMSTTATSLLTLNTKRAEETVFVDK